VILPGVGNVGDTWARLQRFDLIDTLRSLTQPVLGICVGMQIMFEHCDEAGIDTLGLFEGRVRRLAPAPGRRVPHCGWNRIELARATPLTRAMPEAASDYVYFVHSFAAGVGPQTVATADHGTRFAAAVARDNFHGVQFHPERSADPGRAWLAGFLRL
jgi:glutamine amidotransferase